MQQKKVKLMDLIIDPALKVREIDTYLQARYSEAFKAGAEFPPLVIDSKNRIICGLHRYSMYRVNCEPDYDILCDITPLKNDADLIMLALEDNSRHGQQLKTIEKQTAVIRLIKKYKVDPEKVSQILGVRVSRVEEWAGMMVVVREPKGGSHAEPVKKDFKVLAENKTEVKESDYREHRKFDTVSLGRLCKQIISIINRESVWITDEPALKELHSELKMYFSKQNKKGA